MSNDKVIEMFKSMLPKFIRKENIYFLTSAFLLLLLFFLCIFFYQMYKNDERDLQFKQCVVETLRNHLNFQTQNKKDQGIYQDKKKPEENLSINKELYDKLPAPAISEKQEAELLMRELKALIDIHLSGIDRQHSILSLWAGILMILFLIFSFYAIFKVEDTLKFVRNNIRPKINKTIDEKVAKGVAKLNREAEIKLDKVQKQAGEDVTKRYYELDIKLKKGTKEIEHLCEKAKGLFENVEERFNHFLSLTRNINEANRSIIEERYDTAIQIINQIITDETDVNKSYWYHCLGWIHEKKNEIDLAVESYGNAINEKNCPAEYLFDLGRIYYKMEKWEPAIEKLEEAHLCDPHNSDIVSYLILAKYRQGGSQKPDESLEKIDFEVNNNFYNKEIIDIYINYRDYDRALGRLNKLIDMCPLDAELYYLRARTFKEDNKMEQAIASSLQALKLSPYQLKYIFLLCGCYMQNKTTVNKAIACLNDAITFYPQKAECYVYRGACYEMCGEKEKAQEDYRAALKLKPNDAKLKDKLEEM